ncbi:MAG: TonB-dependent receptor, partial [Proteobacteria bacterium]|nr:TonB-dependent receptor [Pseudomonadota bacterium]
MDNELTIQLNALRHFDIDAQDLPAALLQFGEQAELTVMVHHDAGGSTSGLQGEYSIDEALRQLLAGTGLEYRARGDAIVVTRLVADVSVASVGKAANQNANGGNTMQQSVSPQIGRASRGGFLGRITAVLAAAVLGGSNSVVVAAEQDFMEEIIVTAEKREESILEVPVTMSAFGDQLIEQLGMTADEDLENLVPGLQFGYDYEGQGVSMRGIGTHSAVINQADTSVAFYVDGVYSYKPYGLAPNMFDLERIEVARGPQGTLNGRNSIAGAISFVTKKPTDTWDVDVLAEFTDQVTQRYGVAFGGPIIDNWSFRLTGSQYDGDGTQENLGIGDDYGKPDQQMWSAQLRFKNERLDLNLRRSDLKDQGTSRAYVRVTDEPRDVPSFLFFGFWEVPNPYYLYDKEIPSIANCPSAGILPSRQEGGTWNGFCTDLQNKVRSNRGSQQDDSAERWSFNADIELNEHFTLRYTYGENDSHRFSSVDGDNTDRVGSAGNQTVPADLTGAEIDLWIAEGAEYQDTESAWFENDEEESHELQLFSNFDGPFNFVAGVFMYENKTGWQDRQQDWASPHLYMDAEEAVAFIDWDLDGAADWSSCDDFLNNFVLAEDDESTEFVEGLGESPEEIWGCAEGNNHEWKSGGGAGSASESRAVFVSGDYRLNEQWQVSGGLRWLEDEKRIVAEIGNGDHFVSGFLQDIDEENLLPGHPVPWGGVPLESGQIVTPAESTWSTTIGHVSVEYTPTPDLMYYGRLSTGYRAGGFNEAGILWLAAPPEERLVDPTFPAEELLNYELGIKGRFFDQRLTLMA